MSDPWNRPERLEPLNPEPRHTDAGDMENAGYTRVGRAPRLPNMPSMPLEQADNIEEMTREYGPFPTRY